MAAIINTDPLVWVRDEKGRRRLCPIGRISSLKQVTQAEQKHCVDDDSRLDHPEAVPGEGRLKFGESLSPN